MGIQRPDSTIISGQIKNNVSYRVCGRFVDREPSRIMLSCDAASTLPNVKGRFIVKDDDLYEVQSFYFPNTIPAPQPKQQQAYIVDRQTNSEPDIEGITAAVNDLMRNRTKENAKEEPADSAPFDFDFSGFRK